LVKSMPYILYWRIGTVGRYDPCFCLARAITDSFCAQYPITGSLMKPASNPTHYTDLVKELEEAPERSWFSQQMNKWKGFLRFQ
jgi:cytochrome b pre-mRNA-processing protein 6